MIDDGVANKEKARSEGLRKALEVKMSQFPTITHASPHKEEIDNWIIEKRWSSRAIVNELYSKYPNETHPSPVSVDNYRKKYLDQNPDVGSIMRSGSRELANKFLALGEDYYSFTKNVVTLNKNTYERANIGADEEIASGLQSELRSKSIRDYVEVSKLLVVVMQTVGIPRPIEEALDTAEVEVVKNDIDWEKRLDEIKTVFEKSAKRGYT